ncbi:MAG: O-antigen ligase family protein [Candidatus Saccharimonadales bacterium]
MKSTSQATTTKITNYFTAVLLVLAPFHGFLTVWGASLVGHYTWLRAWNAFVLLGLVAVAGWWLVAERKMRRWLVADRLRVAVVLFALVSGCGAVFALAMHPVSPAAVGLGIFQDLRFLAFLLVVWAAAERSDWLRAHWQQLMLGPALVVAAFAVLQLTVLPDDFLKHFGYSAATIEPHETINNDASYPRFASFLRGANPLGAYLVVITGLLAAYYSRLRGRRHWEILAALTAGAMLASFSRSAWIGAAVAVGVVVFLRAVGSKKLRKFLLISLGMVFFSGVSFAAFQNNPHLQNAIFHTSDTSKVAVSSNDQRSGAMTRASKEVLTHPFGGGVGSAGPASVHNALGETKLAENYFLQVGQETGWLGLGLFVSIIFMLGKRLWARRRDKLALACFAGLVGLVVVNMLSHAWADDTLAYVFWGLAGVALADRKAVAVA